LIIIIIRFYSEISDKLTKKPWTLLIYFWIHKKANYTQGYLNLGSMVYLPPDATVQCLKEQYQSVVKAPAIWNDRNANVIF
jgi:hypothetical protein